MDLITRHFKNFKTPKNKPENQSSLHPIPPKQSLPGSPKQSVRPTATPVQVPTDYNIANAISANDLTSLRSLLETQDRRLITQFAEMDLQR